MAAEFLSYRGQGAVDIVALVGEAAYVTYRRRVCRATVTSVSPDGRAAIVQVVAEPGRVHMPDMAALPDPYKVRP